MDYSALATTANTLLKQFGLLVKVSRLGVSVGSGYGVFVGGEAADDTSSASSLLAQTSMSKKSLLLSGLAKEPLVGDTVLADKVSYLVQSVEKVRPATTTVLYKLEIL